MKKLMFAAMAAALVGTASAVETYTYKASVKHTYLKAKTFSKVLGVTLGAKATLYVKYTKTSSLDGYLIQDDTESLRTSTAVISSADLQPGNRCFLVVRNKGAEKGYKFARILPGVIEAKWYDDKLTGSTKTSPAQGYLYIGGEIVTALRGTTFNALDGTEVAAGPYTARALNNWQRLAPAATAPTIAVDDYWFTSAYLFGQYNQPSWASATSVEEYADTWMNHGGLGKAAYYDNIKYFCGRGSGGAGVVLDSLAGGLKAGIWLCTENGENESHSFGLSRTGLVENQLWKSVRVNNPGGVATYTIGYNDDATLGPIGPVTVTKLDMWADGNLDLRTTDVGFGTWSIKRTTTLKSEALTTAENAKITGAAPDWALAAPAATGTKPLLEAIKGALVALKTGNDLFGNVLDGALINYSFYFNYLKQ